MLRVLRNQKGVKQSDVAKYLGIDRSTYAKYESGASEPNLDMVKNIAKYFEVSLEYILTGEKPQATKGPGLDDAGYKEYSRIRCVLNSEGQAQWLNYGHYLATQPQYKAAENAGEVLEFPGSTLRHYLTGPAAGKASPIQGEDFEDIPYPTDAPRNADFCVDVRGDSMEPYIKDGSRVYVRRGESLQQFDVGVFFYAGDVYIKQICADYSGAINLLSANPLRKNCNVNVPKDQVDFLVCFGKVLLPHRLPVPAYQ